ncbi:MAG: 4-hydroxy-tetrahydrodipicolinate reductase [Acidimicrobiales bacterium]
MRVAVFGAGGRMGLEVCRAVVSADDMKLAAAIDPGCAGQGLADLGVETDLKVVGDPALLLDAGIQAAVDFTQLDAARQNLEWLASNEVHAVVGTTGFTDSDIEAFRTSFAASNCVIAPNFAIGAVLMMRFAEIAAPFFETAEIIEFHHENKLDAPSGTALMTADRMAEASSDWLDDPTTNEILAGARGGLGPSGIRVHSVRLRGAVANQEVILGTAGQTLTIRHDSVDRSIYMPGVLLALRAVANRPGLTLGLDELLNL